MEIPLQITFHNMQHSDAVEAKLRERAGKLEKYCDAIIGCRVAVEAPHHHHASGNQFLVRVEVSVPGEKLVASREPGNHHAYTDVYVAIRDAFAAMRRQLEEYECRRRGEVKTHAAPSRGRAAGQNREENFGGVEMSGASPDDAREG